MKKLDNRGFTLVELLAVIVILALIMGIAAYSMQGVIGDVEISSVRTSARNYIEGFRKMLMINGDFAAGDYYISDNMLEKEVSSPWGEYVYYSGTDTSINANLKNKGYSASGATLVCGGTGGTGSFIRVTKDADNNYKYDICLYDSANNFVFASEKVLTKNESSNDYYRSNVTTALTLGTDGKIATTN